MICVQDFYGLTLDALKEAQNDRLWFKTQLKLCGLWFKLKEYGRGAKILRELHRWSTQDRISAEARPAWRTSAVACMHAHTMISDMGMAACCETS